MRKKVPLLSRWATCALVFAALAMYETDASSQARARPHRSAPQSRLLDCPGPGCPATISPGSIREDSSVGEFSLRLDDQPSRHARGIGRAIIILDRVHVVRRGDTLIALAKKYYGNSAEYIRIFEANRETIHVPDLIFPGSVLRIPVLPGYTGDALATGGASSSSRSSDASRTEAQPPMGAGVEVPVEPASVEPEVPADTPEAAAPRASP